MTEFVYEVESENLSGLGGPMGTEYTTTNWRKVFKNIEDAKGYALKDYRKQEQNPKAEIKWEKSGRGLNSGDLRYVMYHIRKIKVG